MSRLSFILLGLAALASPALADSPNENSSPAATGRRALLIGCTKYADIPVHPLEGPANDVVLMRTLLEGRFGFQSAQVVTLAEGREDTLRPTRANIEREFNDLAEAAQPGDQVLILMSGHGTQQPDEDPPDPDDPEPDGLDEVFLPADAQPYDKKTRTIPRAIVDDELGRWVRRIRDRGARVWIIVDSCHSGTIIRGGGDEVERRVPPDTIIPREALLMAEKRAAQTPPREATGPEPVISGDLRHIVALYAAQPEQPTIELPLPRDADDPQTYGLLTYTLNKVLTQAGSRLTYRELAEKIQAEYVQSGRGTPTPLLEGADGDREVLGLAVWPGRSRISLAIKEGEWQLNAGELQGLTVGSILRVFPPAGAVNADKPLGHVRVKKLSGLQAGVEPCEYGDLPAPVKLPAGARCELAYLDCSLHKLRVASDIQSKETQQLAASTLRRLAEKDSLLESAELKNADWVLRESQAQLYLEPRSGLDGNDPTLAPRFGPVDANLGPWLDEHLHRIARGQSLLRLARTTPSDRPAGGELDLAVELLRLRDKNDKEGEPVAWQRQGITFQPGEILACRLKNKGTAPVDATLLFVDAGFGIKAVFPRRGAPTENRIFPGESVLAFRAKVTAKTVGLEHLVLIAVPGKGTTVEFGALEQPALELSRGDQAAGRGLDSPLGRLLQASLYGSGASRGDVRPMPDGKQPVQSSREGAGATRGLHIEDFDEQSLALFSWRVVDKQPPADHPAVKQP